MSLVRDIHLHAAKRRVVGALATLVRELGAQVIAEGVETPVERDAIISAGIELIQGHLQEARAGFSAGDLVKGAEGGAVAKRAEGGAGKWVGEVGGEGEVGGAGGRLRTRLPWLAERRLAGGGPHPPRAPRARCRAERL